MRIASWKMAFSVEIRLSSVILCDLRGLVHPGPRESPSVVGGAAGNAERFARLADVQSAKVMELDDLSLQRMLAGERFEQIADQNHFLGRRTQASGRVTKVDAEVAPPMFDPPLLPRALDQDSP